MGRTTESLDEWFMRAVVPHEASLARYLQRLWRDDPAEIRDLCQEALTRVYTAARKERPMHVKSFLFTTARRLVFDHVRRAQVVPLALRFTILTGKACRSSLDWPVVLAK